MEGETKTSEPNKESKEQPTNKKPPVNVIYCQSFLFKNEFKSFSECGFPTEYCEFEEKCGKEEKKAQNEQEKNEKSNRFRLLVL